VEKQGTDFAFKDYFHIVLRRKYTILLIFFSVMVPLTFYVRNISDSYVTHSQLVIEGVKSNLFSMAPQMFKSSRSFNFYRGIFQSRSFLQIVLDSVGREKFAEFEPDTTDNGIRRFIGASIKLQKSNFQSFVKISATAKSAQMAYDLARVATKVFMRKCREVVAEESESTVGEIDKQLALIREKLESSEREYREYREKFGDAGVGISAELKHLQEKFYGLKSERASQEAIFEANTRMLVMLERRIEPKVKDPKRSKAYKKAKMKLRKKEKEKKRLESMGLQFLRTSKINLEIAELEREIIKHGTRAEDRVDPRVVSHWQKIRKVVAEDEMTLDLINNKVAVYQKKIARYKKKHPDELRQTLEILRLERARKVYEDTYTILLEQSEIAKIRRASETGGLKVIDEVFFPHTPVSRNEKMYYVSGILVSLLLGVGFVLTREFLDTSIKSFNELEGNFDIPVIGTIPHIELGKKESLKIKRKSALSGKKDVVTAIIQGMATISPYAVVFIA